MASYTGSTTLSGQLSRLSSPSTSLPPTPPAMALTQGGREVSSQPTPEHIKTQLRAADIPLTQVTRPKEQVVVSKKLAEDQQYNQRQQAKEGLPTNLKNLISAQSLHTLTSLQLKNNFKQLIEDNKRSKSELGHLSGVLRKTLTALQGISKAAELTIIDGKYGIKAQQLMVHPVVIFPFLEWGTYDVNSKVVAFLANTEITEIEVALKTIQKIGIKCAYLSLKINAHLVSEAKQVLSTIDGLQLNNLTAETLHRRGCLIPQEQQRLILSVKALELISCCGVQELSEEARTHLLSTVLGITVSTLPNRLNNLNSAIRQQLQKEFFRLKPNRQASITAKSLRDVSTQADALADSLNKSIHSQTESLKTLADKNHLAIKKHLNEDRPKPQSPILSQGPSHQSPPNIVFKDTDL